MRGTNTGPPWSLVRSGLVVLLLAGAAAGAAAAPRFLINSSHHGAINDLAYDAQRRLLFSAGDDGTVRVWSHDRRTIVRNLRIGAARVISIALHPEDTLVAMVLRFPGSDDLLEVWDWSAGRSLYRHELDDAPLHVGFTSRGSSLVYTRARFDSVVFLDPRTGRRQRRLPAAFGIVSYVTTSTNERTIMTYQPTGEVRYWDADTMQLKAALPTLANLEEIAVSADRSLLVARAGEEVVAIDVITGAVRYRFPVPRRSLFAVADQLPQVAVLYPSGQEEPGYALRRFTLDRAVAEGSESSLELNGWVTASVYAGRDLFLADRSAIWEAGPTGAQPFVRDELLDPVAFAAGGDTLLVATARRIAVARLQRPQAAAPPGFGLPASVSGALPRLAYATLLRNPFGAAVGLAVISRGELPTFPAPAGVARQPNSDAVVLVWNREGPGGRLGTIDPRTGRYRLRLSDLPAPLIQVSPVDEHLLLLDGIGNITLYPVEQILTGSAFSAPEPVQRYWAPGTSRVVRVGRHLIAGRRSADAITAPLLKIDTGNAETLPVPDDALLIYDLEQSGGSQLLTLGVEAPEGSASGHRVRTVLRLRAGDDLARHRVLHSFSGEDVDAQLAGSAYGRHVYSSVGGDRVRTWDGYRLLPLPPTERRPRQLAVARDLLVARNADATFSVWNRHTRALLFDLYLFRDFNWLVVPPSGNHVHTPGAVRFLACPAAATGRRTPCPDFPGLLRQGAAAPADHLRAP